MRKILHGTARNTLYDRERHEKLEEYVGETEWNKRIDRMKGDRPVKTARDKLPAGQRSIAYPMRTQHNNIDLITGGTKEVKDFTALPWKQEA